MVDYIYNYYMYITLVDCRIYNSNDSKVLNVEHKLLKFYKRVNSKITKTATSNVQSWAHNCNECSVMGT